MLASNRSSLSVSASTFESHLGSLAQLRIDLEQIIVFVNSTVALCDAAEQEHFAMMGSIEEFRSLRITFEDAVFADNVGTIFATAPVSDGAADAVADLVWDCPPAQVDDVFQISRAQFTRSTIASSPSSVAYLLDLQYQRLSFVVLDFTDNYFRDADVTLALTKSGQYDDVVCRSAWRRCTSMPTLDTRSCTL